MLSAAFRRRAARLGRSAPPDQAGRADSEASSRAPVCAASGGFPRGCRSSAHRARPIRGRSAAACNAENRGCRECVIVTPIRGARLRPILLRSAVHTLAEGFIHRRILVPERAGNQPRDRVQHHRRRQFAARKDEIADRNLIRRQMLGHALVHSLVAPAEQDDSLELRESPRRLLPKQISPRPTAARSPFPPRSFAPASPASDSTASNSGSGFITIPSPPPNGRSSTVRCRSCVNSRRSWTCVSISPASRARRTIP